MSTIGNPVKYSNFTSQYLSGTGVQTAYTLTEAVGSANSVLVLIDGVKQFANTYTLNDTALVFSEAPPSGTNNIEIIPLGFKGQVNTVVDASISASKLATNSVTTTKILDGNVTLAKLDSDAQRFVIQGDTSIEVTDTGANGVIEHIVDGAVAAYRNATGAFSYIRGTIGGNSNTLYPEYQCRAWVNFNGGGTIAIRASGNVSSITDNGVGDFVVNFTTAMPDVNYSSSIMVSSDASTAAYAYLAGTASTAVLVSSIRFNTVTNGAAAVDRTYTSLTIHR
jgi:hypothetical protein